MTETGPVQDASKITIVMGVATIILGSLAVIAPFITGITVATIVGIVVLAAGLCRLVFAFKAESFKRGAWTFLLGIVGAAVGGMILARPLLGLASITILLIGYLLFEGVTEIFSSFRLRPVKGWGWLLFSGIAALALGILLWREWPVSGAYAVGILVGIHLIFAGWSMIAVGSATGEIATEARSYA